MERKTDFAVGERRMILAGLAGVSAWIVHLTVSYTLVPESCGDGSKLMLHALTIGCVIVALSAAGIAWRVRAGEVDEGARWMATGVVVLCVAMAIVIVAQEIPNLILRSCD